MEGGWRKFNFLATYHRATQFYKTKRFFSEREKQGAAEPTRSSRDFREAGDDAPPLKIDRGSGHYSLRPEEILNAKTGRRTRWISKRFLKFTGTLRNATNQLYMPDSSRN